MKYLAWTIALAALFLAGCTVPLSGGGLPTLCGVLTTTTGSALGGVTGSFLAGNSVTNNVATTKKGTTITVNATKKNASNGDVALYTLGGTLAGGVITGVLANNLCPSVQTGKPLMFGLASAEPIQNVALHEQYDKQMAENAAE